MGDDDWKKRKRRKEDRDDDDYRKAPKETLTDRIFGLLEGPIATTLVKLIATGLICATTVALTGILAFANAPTSLLISTVGLGLATTAVTWIFGGWKKQAQASVTVQNHDAEILEMARKVAELEERVSNVEIIERFEDRLAARVADSSPGAETTYGSSGIEFER
jgi:predicted RND superfamily exporter protein